MLSAKKNWLKISVGLIAALVTSFFFGIRLSQHATPTKTALMHKNSVRFDGNQLEGLQGKPGARVLVAITPSETVALEKPVILNASIQIRGGADNVHVSWTFPAGIELLSGQEGAIIPHIDPDQTYQIEVTVLAHTPNPSAISVDAIIDVDGSPIGNGAMFVLNARAGTTDQEKAAQSKTLQDSENARNPSSVDTNTEDGAPVSTTTKARKFFM